MTGKKLNNHTKTLSLKPDEHQEYETGGSLADTAMEEKGRGQKAEDRLR
jgi:hypothetical protein